MAQIFEKKMKSSVSLLKKKIRDTKRLVNHSPSPSLQSKLSLLLEQLEKEESKAKRLKIQQKYKYVKFVEKKKLVRRLKTAEKSNDQDQCSILSKQIAYIDHYPTDLKYISILASDQSDEASSKKESILNYLSTVHNETGSWPIKEWEYSVAILGQSKQTKKQELNDDFFL